MATIYFIPVPIADHAWATLSSETLQECKRIKHFFTENIRTARRTLKAMHPDLVIEEIAFEEIDKRGNWNKQQLRQWLSEKKDIGVMSESGMPGIADPGSEIARFAHRNNIAIKVISGPSSIMLALAGSGLNGQRFSFLGYLPVDAQQRIKKIRELEKTSKSEGATQIFIETPYRNQTLMRDLLQFLQPDTLLCVAFHLCSSQELLKTAAVKDWKKNIPELPKAPCIFLIGSA